MAGSASDSSPVKDIATSMAVPATTGPAGDRLTATPGAPPSWAAAGLTPTGANASANASPANPSPKSPANSSVNRRWPVIGLLSSPPVGNRRIGNRQRGMANSGIRVEAGRGVMVGAASGPPRAGSPFRSCGNRSMPTPSGCGSAAGRARAATTRPGAVSEPSPPDRKKPAPAAGQPVANGTVPPGRVAFRVA